MTRSFHFRSFISLLTLLSFLVMLLSGIILYIAPQGRIAYWTFWKFFGLTKTDWTNLHLLSSTLFLVSALFHLYFNWSVLTSYLIDRVKRGLRLRKELSLAVLVVLAFIISAIYQLPPLKYLIVLSDYAKKSWVKSPDYEPPFGHAESLSFKAFAKKMKIDLKAALEELKSRGIEVKSDNQTLEEIARLNKTTPLEIYRLIKKFEKKEEIRAWTPELVEEKFAGSGLGRKTLKEVCQELNLDLETAKKKLLSRNIQMKEEESLREVADRYGTRPIEILKIILVESGE